MLDLPTSYRLLSLLEPGCRLLILGDHALPPISFGVVFHTLVQCGAVPMVELAEVHRQATSTGIPLGAALLRQGIVPEVTEYRGPRKGLQFIPCCQDELFSKMADLWAELSPLGETQILSPLRNAPSGTRELNQLFHCWLIADSAPTFAGFAAGEPVIWTRNDYTLGLMNGSLGTVASVSLRERSLVVQWDDEPRAITNPTDMEHAYAITIHKSQGSQFQRVIIPVFQCRLLDRTMLYTPTRAQEQVILIGDRQAFEAAVMAPPSTSLRRTGLPMALAAAKASVPFG
jgi:exodeoxyribonuclease V alpha subunit